MSHILVLGETWNYNALFQTEKTATTGMTLGRLMGTAKRNP
jgi:hypothetical protein